MTKRWRVRDVMTTAVRTVADNTAFNELIRELKEYRVSALPVIDGVGRLRGIVSEADLLLKEEQAGPQAQGLVPGRTVGSLGRTEVKDLVARDVMTSPVVTVGPDASVFDAARLMREKRIKRLIVVDEYNNIVGIASRIDLLKAFGRDDAAILRDAETILQDVLMMSDCGVRVADGVVSVEGRVHRKSEADALFRLIAQLSGVVDVRGEIQYEVDDSDRPQNLGWLAGSIRSS